MTLVRQSFAATFDFARPIAAPYRLANGSAAVAAANVPRFDHDAQGRRLGLLIESGPLRGLGDRLFVEIEDDWHEHPVMTILHAWRDAEGINRRALYSREPVATVDACLAIAGHQLAIGAFVGLLPERSGVVLYGGERWLLQPLLAADATRLLVDEAAHPILAG